MWVHPLAIEVPNLEVRACHGKRRTVIQTSSTNSSILKQQIHLYLVRHPLVLVLIKAKTKFSWTDLSIWILNNIPPTNQLCPNNIFQTKTSRYNPPLSRKLQTRTRDWPTLRWLYHKCNTIDTKPYKSDIPREVVSSMIRQQTDSIIYNKFRYYKVLVNPQKTKWVEVSN